MFPLSKRALLPFVFVLPAALYASDYTYQQTTQITGGSLLKMMKTVGVFSSQARRMGDPIVSTIYLKDNRLADVSPEQIQIIDLDKETITQVDVQKKTYSVMTFEQMKQAIANARERMQKEAAKQQTKPETAENSDAQNVQMSFDVKVRKTGVTRDVSGLNSSEAILTMTMTATDAKTQQSGNMAMTNDMWMVPSVPGYEQVREFYIKFAAKMGDATVGLGRDFSRMLAQQPGANQAMGDMIKEMQKIDGVPVMQVMRMGTTVNGQALPAASEAPLPNEAPGPSKGEIAKAGMSSMISSRLGGFRRIREEETERAASGAERGSGRGTSNERHPDGDADYDIELFVRTGRSVALRCSHWIQAGDCTDAGAPAGDEHEVSHGVCNRQ